MLDFGPAPIEFTADLPANASINAVFTNPSLAARIAGMLVPTGLPPFPPASDADREPLVHALAKSMGNDRPGLRPFDHDIAMRKRREFMSKREVVRPAIRGTCAFIPVEKKTHYGDKEVVAIRDEEDFVWQWSFVPGGYRFFNPCDPCFITKHVSEVERS